MTTLGTRFETVVEVACDIRESMRRIDGIAWDVERIDISVPGSPAKRLGDMSLSLGRLRDAAKREHPCDNGVLPLLDSVAGQEMPTELAGVMRAQRKQAQALGMRVSALGRAIGDVQLRIAGALRDLAGRSIDGLLLAQLSGGPATRDGLLRAMRNQKQEVAAAQADWRLSMGSTMTFQIADVVRREDVDAALRRLSATDDVRRPFLPWGRYSLTRG